MFLNSFGRRSISRAIRANGQLNRCQKVRWPTQVRPILWAYALIADGAALQLERLPARSWLSKFERSATPGGCGCLSAASSAVKLKYAVKAEGKAARG
jgi:hypothetical protein